jgi:NADPH:quinone reductase-like Zn-dependent oxidoreductase
MKGIVANAFGVADDVLTESLDIPRPRLKPGSDQLLVRVLACGLTPGDVRMLSGEGDLIKKPRAGFPYIPGLDVCGVVEEIDPLSDNSLFQVGDSVVATWSLFGEGGMAEYALVDATMAAKKPECVSAVDGAALANSAGHALTIVREAAIRDGDRVLVLGGSGGVGTSVIQLVRNAGATFVAATSTDESLMKELGVDCFINYREQDWSDVKELQLHPVDVIIDCAVGRRAWNNPRRRTVLKGGKDGGRFVAVVLQDWEIEMHSYMQLPLFLLPPLWRQIWTSIRRRQPRYKMHLEGPNGEVIDEVMKRVESGKLKAVLHGSRSFPFTETGVKVAFGLMETRCAHGKVVVQMT